VEIDKSHFASIVDAQLLSQMFIEIIKAFDDMSEHLHYHAHSDVVITALGAAEGSGAELRSNLVYERLLKC
jgi:DNA-binding NarL/FixJ family response regulator